MKSRRLTVVAVAVFLLALALFALQLNGPWATRENKPSGAEQEQQADHSGMDKIEAAIRTALGR